MKLNLEVSEEELGNEGKLLLHLKILPAEVMFNVYKTRGAS